jgi:hypothetical protein
MFNLEQAITDWRRQMLAAGIKTRILLEELEGHLREEIEQQISSGLSPKIAFHTAANRIGQGDLLKTEFKKIGDMPVNTKKTGYFYAGILVLYSSAMIYLMAINNLSTSEWLWGSASLGVVLISSYLTWRVFPRFYKVMTNRRLQSAVGIFGGISGALWLIMFANLILPRFDFTPRQLVVAILWAMVPTLLLPNIAFLMLDKSENQSLRTTTL